MSGAGKLCYVKNGTALAYKRGGTALIFKVNRLGDVYLMIVSDQTEVGPIKTCGNVHNVLIHTTGFFATGAGTFTVNSTSAGKTSCTIHTTTKPATVEVTCRSESSGCEYPDENPPMDFRISAAQDGSDVKTGTAHVENVANYEGKGIFRFTVSIDANGKLTGVSQ